MARAVWSGSIAFGIVNIPVKLYTAVRDRAVHFHQVSSSQKRRIRYKKVAEGSDDEVPAADIVRGYELSRGRYVLVDDKEMDQLAAAKRRTIDIIDFVALDEIDPLFFEQPYYVVPDEGAGRAYWLLVEALQRAGRVAIAQFVMRSREHLGALRPLHGALALETMRYQDELVQPEELGSDLVAREDVRDRELDVAQRLIDSMTTTFDPSRYKDEYRQRVLEFVQRKADGQGVEVFEEEWGTKGTRQHAEVIDLMAALEASLQQRQGDDQPPDERSGKPRPGKRPAASRGGQARPRRGGKRVG